MGEVRVEYEGPAGSLKLPAREYSVTAKQITGINLLGYIR